MPDDIMRVLGSLSGAANRSGVVTGWSPVRTAQHFALTPCPISELDICAYRDRLIEQGFVEPIGESLDDGMRVIRPIRGTLSERYREARIERGDLSPAIDKPQTNNRHSNA